MFNFLGVLVMTMIAPAVAMTIYNMVDFGSDSHQALVALCAALFAIVIWAVAAWYFGIPTKRKSCADRRTFGCRDRYGGAAGGINGGEWVKVLWGLVLSTMLGFASGWGWPSSPPLSAGGWNAAKPPVFSGVHKSAAGPRPPSCMAHRMVRNHGRLHAGHLPFERQRRR